jgi:integrase
MTSGTADQHDGAGQGALVLHTTLLGDLIVPDGAGRAHELEDLARRATQYAVRARGDGTRRAYRSAWAGYVSWCRDLGREPLAGDPETIAMYAVRRADAGRALSSIRVDLAAIATAHRLAGVPLDLRDARLAPVLEGIARTKGARPQRQAAPAVPDVLRAMLAALGSETAPVKDALLARDRAMLLLGFGAALRRSELVGLTIGDVTVVPGRGLRILVRRSKTDQQGRGQTVAVWANPAEPGFCPAAALERWLAHRHQAADMQEADSETARAERPLFCGLTKAGRLTGVALSDKAVVPLVKQAASAAGLDPARFFRALPARRACHRGRRCRRGPRGADAPDPAPLDRCRAWLSPSRRSLAQ